MKIILNKRGLEMLEQWRRPNPRCGTCLKPRGNGAPKPKPLSDAQDHYNICAACGNAVERHEQTLAYKVRWGKAHRRQVCGDGAGQP